MKSKITERDLLFFFIGFVTLLLIDTIMDWDNNVKAFKEGYNGYSESPRIESKN